MERTLIEFVQSLPKEKLYKVPADSPANRYLETLVPGSPLTIRSRCASGRRGGDPRAKVTFYDEEDHPLVSASSSESFTALCVALLTPYLTATLADVSPVSVAVNRSRMNTYVYVRFELRPFDLNEALEEIHERLGQSAKQSERQSVAGKER